MGVKNEQGKGAAAAKALTDKGLVKVETAGVVTTNWKEQGIHRGTVDGILGALTQKDEMAIVLSDQNEMLTSFIRGTMLKKFGIQSVDGIKANAAKLSLNGFNTGLKLPNPTTNVRGVAVEKFSSYSQRCKPAVAFWLEQMISNSRQIIDATFGATVLESKSQADTVETLEIEEAGVQS